MDPPPARRAESNRRDCRRRQRHAAPAVTMGAGSELLTVERGSAEHGDAAAAAPSSSRRRNRRRRRRRDRAAKAAAEASKSPEAYVPDVDAIQGDSSLQSGFCLEAVLAHSSVSLSQTVTKKIINSNEAKKISLQGGNMTKEVYSKDGEANYSAPNEDFVPYQSDNFDYQDEGPEYPVLRKADLSGNLEDYSSLQELEERKENEDRDSSNLKEEKKKRKKRKGRKSRSRCKETTSQDCPLSDRVDNSGLVVMVSEKNTSCVPMIKSVSVDGAKTKGDRDNVILESISTEIDKLQEQDIASSKHKKTNCLSPSNLAETYVENLKDVFSQRRPFIGFPKKKLLVLDLNGLLADINQEFHNAHMADAKVRGKLVFRRPYCDDFLKFCSFNFDLGIWSSRKKENVASVINIVMRDFRPRLLFCWDMSKCTFTGYKTLENMHKPLMLKELKKLWNKEEPDLPWENGDYSPSNTLLVDDSPYKALLNPTHTAIFPRAYSYLNRNDNSLGPDGDLRVYLQNLASADDVESYVRNNPFGQPFITESDPHWNFYAQIADKRSAIADNGATPLTCYA